VFIGGYSSSRPLSGCYPHVLPRSASAGTPSPQTNGNTFPHVGADLASVWSRDYHLANVARRRSTAEAKPRPS
jgi:hypothetical protein